MLKWIIFFTLNIVMLGYVLLLSLVAAPACVSSKATIFDLVANSTSGPLVRYPTQLTQNIVPKQIHSHNDCKLAADTRAGETKPLILFEQTGAMFLCFQR